MKIVFGVLALFFLSSIVCCAQEKIPDGELVYFYYSTYGSSTFHSRHYSVELDNGKEMAALDGWAGVQHFTIPTAEDEMAEVQGESMLKDLQAIIVKEEIYKWNGFKKNNTMILDSDGFSLRARYSTGKEIKARGYGDTPRGYEKAANALQDYFAKRAMAWQSSKAAE